MDNRKISIASPEDLIIHKLHWHRLGEGASDRQWNDIQGILRVQGHSLDRYYLGYAANEMNVQDLLEQALKEAGLSDP